MLNVAVFATAVSALADVHYVDVNITNAPLNSLNFALVHLSLMHR